MKAKTTLLSLIGAGMISFGIADTTEAEEDKFLEAIGDLSGLFSSTIGQDVLESGKTLNGDKLDRQEYGQMLRYNAAITDFNKSRNDRARNERRHQETVGAIRGSGTQVNINMSGGEERRYGKRSRIEGKVPDSPIESKFRFPDKMKEFRGKHKDIEDIFGRIKTYVKENKGAHPDCLKECTRVVKRIPRFRQKIDHFEYENDNKLTKKEKEYLKYMDYSTRSSEKAARLLGSYEACQKNYNRYLFKNLFKSAMKIRDMKYETYDQVKRNKEIVDEGSEKLIIYREEHSEASWMFEGATKEIKNKYKRLGEQYEKASYFYKKEKEKIKEMENKGQRN